MIQQHYPTNKSDLLFSRIFRVEQRLEHLRADAYHTREQFANAVRMCDTSKMQETGKRYAERMSNIAQMELIVLQAMIERSDLQQKLGNR